MKTVRLITEWNPTGGRTYNAGVLLSLRDERADWLVAQGKAVHHGNAGSPARGSTSTPAAHNATSARRGCCGRR
jgi:hypothetical protein